MDKYLIVYNTGYGDIPEVVEASSQDEADEMAYDAWRDAVDHEYWAKEFTKEHAEEYDLEWEE